MKLGYPNHPRRDLMDEIDWAGRHGFEFLDLFLEPDAAGLDRIDPAAVRDRLARWGLDCVGHLAWYLPIGSPMRCLREAALEAACAHLPVLAGAGAGAFTIHANWPTRLFETAEGVQWQIETLRRLVEAARAHGLTVLYEPVGSERDTAESLEAILGAVPELACHLDTGHCNLCGRKPAAMIRRFGARLRHVHAHDNDGCSDLHLPPGTGNIDWPDVVAALRGVGYDGTVTLEVFSPDRAYVLLARQRLAELWADRTTSEGTA